MKCLCFCYLGLELALTRGPVALLSGAHAGLHATVRTGAEVLTSLTAMFCFVRALPVLIAGWKYFASNVGRVREAKSLTEGAAS